MLLFVHNISMQFEFKIDLIVWKLKEILQLENPLLTV